MSMTTEGPNRAQLGDTLKRLRESRGSTFVDATARHKQWRAVRKTIASRLASGESTVPAIAEATRIPPSDVLWHISGMRKYGLIEECGVSDGYPMYRQRTTDTVDGTEE